MNESVARASSPSPPCCSPCCSAACSSPLRAAAAARGRAASAAPFTLTDQNGRRVSDRDFAGKYRLIYFGYTFCPDVCPIDMQVIGAGAAPLREGGSRRAPPRSSRSSSRVDPARDTPAVLQPLRRRLPSAADRPHRQRRPRSPGRAGISRSSTSAATGSAGGGYMVNHTRMAMLLWARRRADRDASARQGAGGVAAELDRWVQMRDRFWEAADRALDRERMGGAVRRLRQMLPAQARG